MTQTKRAYVDGHWGQIHLRLTPSDRDAPPLLMLHQTPKSGWIWEPLFPHLGQGRTLVAPDTPGYGASDGPPPGAVSIEDYAREMLALMDRLEAQGVAAGQPFDVMGYHTGSVIAVAMARIAPDRVRRIVPVSLPLFTAEERAARIERLAEKPVLSADGSHLKASWDSIDRFTDPRAALDWKQHSLVEHLRAGAAMNRGFGAVYRYDLEAALRGVTQPMLLLNPQDDLWAYTHRAAAMMPAARMVTFEGASHGLFAIDGEKIAAEVAGFLEG